MKQAKLKLVETKEHTAVELEKLELEFRDIEHQVIERTNECEVLLKFKVVTHICIGYLIEALEIFG